MGEQKNFYLILISSLGLFFLFLIGGLLVYGSLYQNRVLPNVFVGDVPMGGLTSGEVVETINGRAHALAASGIKITAIAQSGHSEITLPPIITSTSGPQVLLSIDTNAAAQQVLSYGKTGNLWVRLTSPFFAKLKHSAIQINDVNVSPALKSILSERLSPNEQAPQNAGIVIESIDPIRYYVVSSTNGTSYDYDSAVSQIKKAWSNLAVAEAALATNIKTPEISTADLEMLLPGLPNLLTNTKKLRLVGFDPYTTVTTTWDLPMEKIASWLNPTRKDGVVTWTLKSRGLDTFLKSTVAPVLAVDSRDAVFEMDNSGKITKFQSSIAGQSLDLEETARAIDSVFLSNGSEINDISVVIKVLQPHVSTEQANVFGIKDLLGVGISDFSGSPNNRIKNIANAVKKLNGLLIAPGEIFSTLEHTAPFTTTSGYYSELVIKGDQIKPEVGGGLCQIGTTLFRMAMNSGMPIVERRNHSLVINHYNDPTNGNPGTDATIYDPAPDFRFKNDTDYHLLIETDMNTKRGILTFRLWGVSDGRSGSYTPPVVKKWIPHEDTKIVETNKLPVGEKKCQNAFNGAETYFTYTRLLPDGTKEDRVFTSYYRPLQEICLLGVAETVSSTVPNTDVPLVID